MGGARGEVARENSAEAKTMEAKISSQLIAGTIVMIREGVAMAVPAVEQIGQMCEATELELRSAQQCNCAPRKTTPRSIARK